MKLGEIKTTLDKQALQYFYAFVRDDESAYKWHLLYTPYFEDHEIKQLAKDYDFEEIKNIWEGKGKNQLESLILK